MRAGRLSAAALGLGLSLAGCAHYASAPPHPEHFPATLDARQLPAHDGAWRAADLLAVAIAQNPQIGEARAKYATALAAVQSARAPPGPSLTLTAEYANESPHWGYSGGGDIPLDYGARRSTRIGTAELQALQAFLRPGRGDLERAHGSGEGAG